MKARTIGVLAREAGVNVETIRFYEREGLLQRPPQPTSGWRIYDDEAVRTIRTIRLAEQMGLSLDDLRRFGRRMLDGGSICHDCRSTLERKLVATDRQLARLATMRSRIERTLAGCQANTGRDACPILSGLATHAVPRRHSR